MKKTMILALAVLGIVLGSFAVVQPVKAQGGPCGPVIRSGIVKSKSAENVFITSAQPVILSDAFREDEKSNHYLLKHCYSFHDLMQK